MYFSERVSQCEPVESTRRYMASMGLGRETSMEKKNFEYDKLLIHINKKDPNCRYQEFFASIEDGIDIIDRLNGMYELVQKGYSKATAIGIYETASGTYEGRGVCVRRQQQRSVYV